MAAGLGRLAAVFRPSRPHHGRLSARLQCVERLFRAAGASGGLCVALCRGGALFHHRLVHGAIRGTMNRFLILAGLVLVAVGLLWPYLTRLGLGRLPGDIAIQGEHGGFYFPIVTCIVVSLVLSLIFWLAGKL